MFSIKDEKTDLQQLFLQRLQLDNVTKPAFTTLSENITCVAASVHASWLDSFEKSFIT